jgi:hypothetical protein
MFKRLRLRVYIWALNRGWLYVEPWMDPRRSEADRATWLEAQPKSLKKVS